MHDDQFPEIQIGAEYHPVFADCAFDNFLIGTAGAFLDNPRNIMSLVSQPFDKIPTKVLVSEQPHTASSSRNTVRVRESCVAAYPNAARMWSGFSVGY